jgi:glutamate--cysteine ligase
MWRESARDGLSHPALRDAASACFALALDSLPDMGADSETIDVVGAFIERYVARGLSPADERLRQWHDRGCLLPSPDNAVPVAAGTAWT